MIFLPTLLPVWLYDWADARHGTRAAPPSVDTPPYVRGARRAGASLAARGLANLREPEAPIGDVVAALAVLPNPDLGWDAFNRVLMMAYAASGGRLEAKEAVRSWSRQSRKHADEEIDERWQHYGGSPPTELGYGSLVFEVRRAIPDWCPPSRAPAEVVPDGELPAADQPESGKLPPEGAETTEDIFGEPIEKKPNGYHSAEETLGPQFAKSNPDNPLIELNKKYAVIGNIGGKCMVLEWVPSKVDEAVKVPSFQTFRSFSERYANRYVKVQVENKKGEKVEETKQLGPHWLKWTKRKNYEGIDLVPNGPALLPGGYLNLWSGFAVPPVAGEWSLMRRHIREVLAGGNDEAALYVVRWAAWAVQNPDRRAEVALVFRGDKGSGKGTFANALKSLFGQHGLQIYNSKHLVGNFNGHLRNCILLFADEAFWAGDKAGESVLKGMLTAPTLVNEQKGIDATPWRNQLHVIMAANAEWVVPAGKSERRYAMFDVSSSRVGDRAYFAALNAEMASGGLGAMLHDLQALDLKGWHPRQIVATEALRQQKERSMDSRWGWLEGLLQQGWLPQSSTGGPDTSAALWLMESLREFDPRFNITPQALGRFLRSVGGIVIHTAHGNQWRFLALVTMREKFAEAWGTWPWDEDVSEWRTKGDVSREMKNKPSL